MEYLDTLKKLINGEMVCAMQYKIASEALTGNDNFSYVKEHCDEHSEEELDHYEQLVAALMQRGETPDMNLSQLIANADPQTVEMTSCDTASVIKFFADAEEAAINAYLDYHKVIADIDADLDDVIMGIIEDERDHKLDFNRLTSIEKADISDEKNVEEDDTEEKSETDEEDEKENEESVEDENEDEDDKEEKDLIKNSEHLTFRRKSGNELLSEKLHGKLSYKNQLSKFIERLDK